MGKKLHLTSLFYRMAGSRPSSSPPPSWLWPSCKHPRTHSFRKEGEVYIDFISAPAPENFSSVLEASASDAIEAMIHGLRSDRLFFEPAGATSSIVEEAETGKAGSTTAPLEGSIAMAVDSVDPYLDFKLSMKEMVVAHGVMDWEWLEEMLVWYLNMNGKRTHGVIVGAFVDLLLSLASSSPPPPPPRSSSPSSIFDMEDEDVAC
ncbi:hypothetical protein GW17_00036958 [Ensete ventricosum]|nr:hypothetical protein GW17_00036958 [Ensete ventricosum]